MEDLSRLESMRDVPDGVLARIDKYELTRELGGGGFGTVYLARDTVAKIDRAVKGLPPEVKGNPEELENIRANFALVSRLHHPNIAAALDLHRAEHVRYGDAETHENLRVSPGETLMVMEYAPGVTLSKWRRQFPESKVPLPQALEIARQIAAALDYAHGQKIIHRDIKPSNVMVETKGDGRLVARVLDFGLAAEIRSSMGRVSCEVRDTSGTRPYMAPEQWLGEKQGAATDQYSLAVLFHELVTGEVPFASVFDTGDPVVMMNVVGREPVKLPGCLSTCVRDSLAKAFAKKPEDRFASCGEFVTALEGKASCGGMERKGGIGKALVILVLLAVLAGGAWWWTSGRNETNEPAAAQVPPVPVGPTESDVAEIAVEATVQKARVERIDDADGFKMKKTALADALTRAVANRTELRWAEAARGFTNYVDGCKALVALDAERQAAMKSGKEASAARKRAQDATAEKYAAIRWNEAEKQMASATAAFGVMRFAEADKVFSLAQKQFSTSVAEANAERKRQKEEAAEQRKKNAEEARSRALEASKEADASGAKECASDEWKAATEARDRGKAAWGAGNLEAAIAAFDDASRHYKACLQTARAQAEKVKEAYALFERGRYKELMDKFTGKDANLPDVAYLQGSVYEGGLLSVPDWKKACERYEVAVKHDHPLACAALGVLHSGKYDFLFGMERQDKERGLSLINGAKDKLRSMAEANNIYAQDLLGCLYWEGLGYETNRNTAIGWYMKGKERCLSDASQGILDAQLAAGCRWKVGQWGETNYVEAVRWLRKAADQGLAIAQTHLGLMYWEGEGVRQDYYEAVRWLRKAADQGPAVAQVFMGRAYAEGWGVEKDYDEAMKWYRKAADQGLAVAQHNIGVMYWDGEGVRMDYYEAVRWLRKAANQGVADAQNLMGRAYNNGWGVEKDYDEAMRWYRKAAVQGLAIAQQNIGAMYWDGEGVRRDYYEAVRWLRKAANQGVADAQNLMGRAYNNGWGVEKDYDEAMRWYRKAADQGLAVAQNNIGIMYWDGEGVRKDYYEAVRWLRKAANQGMADAQNLMGRAYDEGWGVEKDYDEAMKWYRKAADQGLAIAQHNIGIMYWEGNGVQQNRYEALRWLRKAVDNGCEDAKNTLKSFGYD